jgi:hypothetical protein
MEYSIEWELTKETEVLVENLPNITFSITISTITGLWWKSGRTGEKSATNHLGYDTIVNSYITWGSNPISKILFEKLYFN